jgi:predicted nucleic acid-binding protein
MTRALVDVNVFMDVLQRRAGWVDSLETINRVRHDVVEGWISALTVPIVYFLRLRYTTEEQARADAATITQGFGIVSLTEEIITRARESELPDFEDNIQLFSAIEVNADYLVTRNRAHFQQEMVEVVTPAEFLNLTAQAGAET